MSDNNIYIVEAEGITGFRKFVSAASSSSAKAAIARNILTVRKATPGELLYVSPADVIDASTGETLDTAGEPKDPVPQNGELPLEVPAADAVPPAEAEQNPEA